MGIAAKLNRLPPALIVGIATPTRFRQRCRAADGLQEPLADIAGCNVDNALVINAA